MKTIRVIDLLIKSANGEELPRKIKFKNEIYILGNCYKCSYYLNGNELGPDLLRKRYLDLKCFLNEKVEIIEDLEIKDKLMVTKKDIDNILKDTHIKVQKYGDKTTVLMATLPNDYVITVYSSCVDSRNYDAVIGEKECMKKLLDKVYELEAYRILYEKTQLDKLDLTKPVKLITVIRNTSESGLNIEKEEEII